MRLKFVRPINDVRMIDADDFRCTIVSVPDKDTYLAEYVYRQEGGPPRFVPPARFVFDAEPAHVAGWPIDVLIVQVEGKGNYVCPASCDLYVLNDTGKTIERFRGTSTAPAEGYGNCEFPDGALSAGKVRQPKETLPKETLHELWLYYSIFSGITDVTLYEMEHIERGGSPEWLAAIKHDECVYCGSTNIRTVAVDQSALRHGKLPTEALAFCNACTVAFRGDPDMLRRPHEA